MTSGRSVHLLCVNQYLSNVADDIWRSHHSLAFRAPPLFCMKKSHLLFPLLSSVMPRLQLTEANHDDDDALLTLTSLVFLSLHYKPNQQYRETSPIDCLGSSPNVGLWLYLPSISPLLSFFEHIVERGTISIPASKRFT